MGRRFIVPACALATLAWQLAALAGTAGPSAAGAAPVHNRGVTIDAVPSDIIAGEAVLIYGQLEGSDHAGQKIRLYHRINPDPSFALVSTTTTNAAGQYEFIRAEANVLTNRSWFVRGPGFAHSRTVHEDVAALVGLTANSPTGISRQPIAFSGHVTPDHIGGVVALEEQVGSSDRWTRLKRAVVGAGSDFNISYAWRVPGAYDVRVLFRGDVRNTAATADPTEVVIQQAEVPDFTIQTSDPIVTIGKAATVSGTLYQPGTTTPESNTSVSLFRRMPDGGLFQEVAKTTTGADGSYSFPNMTSTTNELYQVRTFKPIRRTAVLFEGVKDVVTMTSNTTASTVAEHVAFTGSVSPDQAGHVIYLERLGADDNWHVVDVGFVNNASVFQFERAFGTAGTKVLRARIIGGPANVGDVSTPPVKIDVTQPPLASLPTA